MSELPQSVVRGAAPREGEAVGAAAALARQVAQWHEAGRWHGQVGVATVTFDASHGPRLTEPEAVFRLGDTAGDWERLPPILHDRLPLELSSDLSLARRRLTAVGIALDPVQIDLYSLSALLCRWITGESASAFLRSPKVKRLVPDPLRPILERALGSQAENRFVDLAEFADALQVAGRRTDQPTEPIHSRPAEHSSTGDTTPSRLSALPGNDTSVIGPAAGASPKKPSSNRDEEPRSGQPEDIPFATLGHYEIRQRIGHGGMGDVYLGYERPLDRLVAIKVLPIDLARDAEFVRRFRAEATAVARLIHPNIVPIFYIGEDQGHHFYVMQFIDGESLADLLARRGKLSVEVALPIVEQTLAGLALAHEQGMVHRDIKPGNILLDQNRRRALLADFGLVKSLSASVTGKTATGVVMGTVDYISPEQGRGQAVDARSDLYSMGVLLFRMLSGELPFTADSPTALIFQHVYEKPPALSSRVSGVPGELEAVIERLLAKSAGDRYPDARTLLSDLQAVRTGRPIVVVDSTKSIQEPSPDRTSPTRIIAAPTLEEELDSLPEAGSFTPPGLWDRARSLFWRHAPEAVQNLQGTQQLIDGAILRKRRQEELLRRLAAEAESILGHLNGQERDQRAVAERLKHQSAAGDAPTVIHASQADEIAALQEADLLRAHAAEQQEQLDQIRLNLAQCVSRRQQLENQRDILNARLRVAEARGTPSTRRPASAGARLRIIGALILMVVFPLALYLNQKATDESRNLQAIPSAIWATQLDAPSTRSDSDGADLSGSAPLSLLAVPLLQIEDQPGSRRGAIQGIGFHRNGNQLAVLGSSQNTLYNVETWAAVMSTQTTVAGALERATSQVPTADLTTFVVGTAGGSPDGGRLELRDFGTGQLQARSPSLGTSADSIALHPSGNMIAAIHTSSGGMGSGQIWDFPALTRSRPLLDGATDITALAFHPDEKHMICGTATGQIHLIRLEDGRTLRTLSGPTARISHFDFTRDGRALVAGDDNGGVRLWDSQSWQLGGRFHAHRRAIVALRFSPDGRALATADESGTLLWDTASGVVRSVLRTRGPVYLEFHPSKPWLLTAERKSPTITLWNASADPEPRLDVESTTGVPLDSGSPVTARIHAMDRSSALSGAGNSVWLVDNDLRTAVEKFKGHSGTIRDLSLSADRRTLATGGDDGQVRTWNAMSGALTATYSLPPEGPLEARRVHAVALAPDGVQFLCGGPAGLFGPPVQSRETLRRLPCDLEQISSIAWGMHSGRAVVAGLSPRTGRASLVVWDTQGDSPLSTLELPTSDPVRRVALALSDAAVVVSVGQFVRLLSLDDWGLRQEWKLPRDGSGEIAVSASGRLLILNDANHVGIWDVERGNAVVRLSNVDRSLSAESLAFTPDNRHAIIRNRAMTLTWRRVTPYGLLHDGFSPNLREFLPALQDFWSQAATSNVGRTADWQLLRLTENPNLRLPVPKELSRNQQFVTDGGWWLNEGVLIQAPGVARSAIDFGDLNDAQIDLSYDPGTGNQLLFLMGLADGRGYCLHKPAESDGSEWLLTAVPQGTARKVRVPRTPNKVGPERNLSFNLAHGGLTIIERRIGKSEPAISMPGFQKGRLMLGVERGPAGAAPVRIGELKINQ